ncbi:hypothetical protein [Nereida sp. MMG025]|uniref:hypothetical protein n=1 Tax=Nereida sp. MMG025 TaxID=2909981 RepID=UPI001F2BFDFE|nr:hypothetical protein [Nereida sp. MMG025]MCF6443132.1 hypothetical protein [Nereida sp. MMG025]
MAIDTTSFDARMKRINKAHGNVMHGAGAGKRKSGMVKGFLTGLVAYIAFSLAELHLMGTLRIGFPTLGALAMALAGTFAIGWGLRNFLKVQGKKVMQGHLAGIAIAAATLHLGAHLAPAQFEMAFSSDWVATVTERTEPTLLTRNAGILSAQNTVVTAVLDSQVYQDLTNPKEQ